MAGNQTHRICNLLPSKQTENDWRLQDALAAGALEAVAALPPSCDLREPWWTIGDQGNTGSCVGWASTDGVMRYHLVKAQKLGQTDRLSPRYTWMASKEIDEFVSRPETFIETSGTSLKAAMDICRKYGVVLDELLPFHLDMLMYRGTEKEFYAAAALRRAAAYFNLGKNLNQWRTWLVSNGPILAGLAVDATWDSALDTNGLLDQFQPDTVRGGHAVCIVGYTSDNRFIIRNSWGTTTWGDKGFGYASEAYINAAFFNESYGATL
ncbi:C1 family peptidase [Cupriavidus sp. L7L]|uniref:C1 family peptidase n=1 Tax=Cupriavidus sp. L7L TaxID=2546443 RepID=UPI0010564163|nr:C1 family peptidase [Cupriavidus sp. L7L]TDF59519.1 hypothetical protein E1J61_34640 [Cupriavidus sp. L7L]